MFRPLSEETHPSDSYGLEEIDRVTYDLRKVLKSLGMKFSFQSPPFSRQSTTLVLRSDGDLTKVKSHVSLNLGFRSDDLGRSFWKSLDGMDLIITFPLVSTSDGKSNRLAIRIAYQPQ
jgi:hypothetical protein